jgi:hypothetical protein
MDTPGKQPVKVHPLVETRLEDVRIEVMSHDLIPYGLRSGT